MIDEPVMVLEDVEVFEWVGEPVPKGRPRFSMTGHAFTPTRTREAEKAISWFLKLTRKRKMLHGPVVVEIEFLFRKPKSNKTLFHVQKPDLDNLGKLVMDAGNGILWKDDCQIVHKQLHKRWAADVEHEGFILRVYAV